MELCDKASSPKVTAEEVRQMEKITSTIKLDKLFSTDDDKTRKRARTASPEVLIRKRACITAKKQILSQERMRVKVDISKAKPITNWYNFFQQADSLNNQVR
jgi:hypothetical protein